MGNYKVGDILMENNCIYGPCYDCVFTDCIYTEEDEFEGMGRG